jgi:hypothetical protein
MSPTRPAVVLRRRPTNTRHLSHRDLWRQLDHAVSRVHPVAGKPAAHSSGQALSCEITFVDHHRLWCSARLMLDECWMFERPAVGRLLASP